MKLKQFLAIGAIAFITLGLNACSKPPSESLQESLNLGTYHGMNITWVKDDSTADAQGFYVIDDTTPVIDKGHKNDNFSDERLIGHYENLDVFFVDDDSNADSKGLYLFKNKDGSIVPSITFAETFSSGKHTTTKNLATIFKSSIKNQESMTINLDRTSVDVEELTPNQIIVLSNRLLEIAKEKEYLNSIGNKDKTKSLDF